MTHPAKGSQIANNTTGGIVENIIADSPRSNFHSSWSAPFRYLAAEVLDARPRRADRPKLAVIANIRDRIGGDVVAIALDKAGADVAVNYRSGGCFFKNCILQE